VRRGRGRPGRRTVRRACRGTRAAYVHPRICGPPPRARFGPTSRRSICSQPRSGRRWPAAPGVHLLRNLGPRTLESIARLARAVRRPGDIAVASIHWGPNWGYGIPRSHRRFAHALIDRAGIDVVHGRLRVGHRSAAPPDQRTPGGARSHSRSKRWAMSSRFSMAPDCAAIRQAYSRRVAAGSAPCPTATRHWAQ